MYTSIVYNLLGRNTLIYILLYYVLHIMSYCIVIVYYYILYILYYNPYIFVYAIWFHQIC